MAIISLRNSLFIKQAKSNTKDGENMNTDIVRNEIDNLIREHKTIINHQYYCEVDDLTSSELSKLVSILWFKDEGFKDYVKDYVHSLIQGRVGWVQSQDSYEKGLRPIKDNVTGETMWINLGD